MKTFRDFETRSEFINYLGLYQKNVNGVPDFHKIANVSLSDYQPELDQIHRDIETIRETWNDQSINQIEQSVSKKGQRQLEIMKGQKNEKLLAGYKSDDPMYRINNCGPDSFFTHLSKQLGLDQGLARYHVQFPGEVTAWHTDIFSPAHEFLDESAEDQNDESVGRDKNIRRILIALEDWKWGQFLQFGMTPWLDWKAGDIIYWNYGVAHGGANMGYVPRISVSITGKITDRFMDICHNAKHRH
jgi:hypothetical protein